MNSIQSYIKPLKIPNPFQELLMKCSKCFYDENHLTRPHMRTTPKFNLRFINSHSHPVPVQEERDLVRWLWKPSFSLALRSRRIASSGTVEWRSPAGSCSARSGWSEDSNLSWAAACIHARRLRQTWIVTAPLGLVEPSPSSYHRCWSRTERPVPKTLCEWRGKREMHVYKWALFAVSPQSHSYISRAFLGICECDERLMSLTADQKRMFSCEYSLRR